MKKIYDSYIKNEIKLEKWQIVGVIFLVVVSAGIIGWIYEYIFYFFNSGMKKFYWRGANFLPWINIYATGSLMIIILTKKLKQKPILVFMVSLISTGILEYISGLFMYKLGGLRCWNYNTEILNFGNIGGFVCLRSVLCFATSALLLVYIIVPFFIYLSKKINKKVFLFISIFLFTVFISDELYNLVVARVLNLPRASNIYKELGISYMNYYKN